MMNWQEFTQTQQQLPYFQSLQAYLHARTQAGAVIYPQSEEIFAAYQLTPLDSVRVVILGQDPYHGEGQAHGLSFSVNRGIAIPPSLRNIYKELSADNVEFDIPEHGDLRGWAAQGVMLLNTVLTVEQGQAHSHANQGWEQFTDKSIELISEQCQGVVFILWGAHAKKKSKLIDAQRHFILSGPHPSPLSAHRGFFGCKHFSKCNELLLAQGKQPIDWQIK